MWNNLLNAPGRYLHAFLESLAGPIPVDKMRASWAEKIESFAKVPEGYKSFFEPLLTEGGSFPYTVRTPTFEEFLHPTTEKLICSVDHEICVLEKSGSTFIPQRYPLEGISYVEFSTILLDSHFIINGVTRDGVHSSSTLRFNTATDYMFTPILEKIRLANAAYRVKAPVSESGTFDQWMDLDFKFMNYARRSVLEGEPVVHAVFQPEIRTKVFSILGITYSRRISPTFACILTNRELIIIREEEKEIASERYGGIWDYIPLQKIEEVSLTPRDSNLLKLTIRLPGEDHLDFLYPSSAKQEVDLLMDRFRELTSARE
jgi:hypothetical protein